MLKRLRVKKGVTLKLSSNQPDWWLMGLVLGLTIFGLVMVANVSVVEAFQDFSDQYYYFRLQLIWAAIGVPAFFLASFVNYHRFKKFAFPLMLGALFLLVLVLIPGVGTEVMGAKRWLGVGGFSFQPAELVKLAFVIYLSFFLSKKRKPWPFLSLLGIILLLIMLEPDLGTALIVSATGMIVYFASGAPLLLIGGVGSLGILGVVGLILSSNYRRERFLTFINPGRDPLGASYHIRQILIALGSGGLTGLGLGQSRQKHEFLPAVTTDSIFAVIGEELGFVGAFLVISCYLFFIWRGIKIAKEA
ncbi:FtsW/RodA/SpoVE family cell cycle protein, partial [Patescibacteria group bacterium]